MRAVDLFAGAGGFSHGAHLAGVEVVAAVNHWKLAVDTHAAAFPAARHYCEDAAVLDPHDLPAFDLLLAAPSCTGHTRARGKEQPHHDAARATAWCVIRVAELRRPPAILVENVPEMLRWVLFRAWRLALSDLGYRVAEHIMDAADAGVPQHRKRLIITATQGLRPVRLPDPAKAHVAARGFLDLAKGPWASVSGWCERTRERVENGQRAHGPDVLIPYYGNERGGRSLDRPIGTLTTVDRYALVRGDKGRMLSVEEMLRLSSFPAGYPLAGTRRDQTKLIGNAVPPLLGQHVVASALAGGMFR